MDHYVDICVRPDPEFTDSLLMNALFSKFHRVLVGFDNRDLGVSFPRHNVERPSLGDCLRVHGSVESLQRLMADNWLTGMQDHTAVGAVEPVPENAVHCRLRRVQPKSNADRIRRRHMKRHGATYEEAVQKIPDSVEQRVRLPFIKIKSQSSGKHFRLFIEHMTPLAQPVNGEFNTYGLSRTATVPWF